MPARLSPPPDFPSLAARPAPQVFRTDISVNGRARELHIPAGAQDDARAIFEGREYPTKLFRAATVSTILDIGAHVGFASLYFHMQFPSAQIHAFEPVRENQALFRANLRGLPGVQLHPFGLGASDEQRTLHLSRQFGLGASSVVKTRDHEDESEEIELRSASEVVGSLLAPDESISLLKIDTEGFEFVLLEQLKAWLPRTDAIFLEVHSDRRRRDIDRLLDQDFLLRHCEVPFGHRIKLLYLSRAAMLQKRVTSVFAPEIFI